MITRTPSIRETLAKGTHGAQTTLRGWVRTHRGSKNVSFIALNDGSTTENIQVVVEAGEVPEETLKQIHTGAALECSGTLVASQGSGQAIELQCTAIHVYGESDPDTYPIQPKKHSLEFLREHAHLRMRTQTFASVFRLRHGLSMAIHTFFDQRGFFHLHSPILTGNDAEGGGETFRVTQLDLQQVPKTEDGQIDFSQDFFGKPVNLTVSGQLEGEIAATALSKIYTFGPTFRAENSNTSRHLAEFWMMEPEMAFYDLEDTMTLAEEMFQFCITYVLEKYPNELALLDARFTQEESKKKATERASQGLLEKLKSNVESPVVRISYTEAFEILRNSKPNKKKKFKYLVEEWGMDFQSEHERYLVEKAFQSPVIIYDYPKDIKAFYMRQNEDGKTVRAMDFLVSGIGELMGGSQREERLEPLKERMKEMEIPEEELWWYLDLRKFGTVPHSGFGLGFERLVQYVTGMGNIRDVIPFPRTPQNIEF